MQKPLDPNKEKFAKGTAPQMTKEEAAKMKEDTYNLMKEDIEFMRLKDEYERLQVQAYEHAVLLGRLEPSQVPGMLGLELIRRDIEAQSWLAQFKRGIEQGMAEEQQKEKGEGIPAEEQPKG